MNSPARLFNMILPILCLVGLTVFVVPSLAELEKPFFLLPRYDTSNKEGNRDAQSCVLQKNLAAHLKFTVEKIIPRGIRELPAMVAAHVLDGHKFHIAYNTDYPDLYHFHLRYSTVPSIGFTGLDFAGFLNSKNYHLQFHSTEHFDLMQIQWLQEIAALNEPSVQEWAEKRLAKATAPATSGYAGSTLQSVPSERFELLSDANVLNLSLLWHQRLGKSSPGMDFLALRVAILNDPLHHTSEVNEILNWRSVASHDDRFEILPSLDLPDIWQPVDFFFSKISENQELAAEIRAFTARTGQAWVNNFDGEHGKFFSPSASLRKDSADTMVKIYKAIAASPDELNTLKHTVLDNTAYTDAITLQGDYVVAIHYHISRVKCP